MSKTEGPEEQDNMESLNGVVLKVVLSNSKPLDPSFLNHQISNDEDEIDIRSIAM